MNTQWFDVDRAGLGKQAEEQGKGRLVGELIQNALDEPGVTKIDVTWHSSQADRWLSCPLKMMLPKGFTT